MIGRLLEDIPSGQSGWLVACDDRGRPNGKTWVAANIFHRPLYGGSVVRAERIADEETGREELLVVGEID